MSKVRTFFDEVQMAAESGGKQFDKNGKPLVGRYPDGTTPTKGKEAYGAGQMQIGTAKATAAQFNIPWDEKKFMEDREYNLDLADKHMQHLTRKYGDRTIARAAYHQGEPTVDKAIATHGRANFANGIGPLGKKYIQMGGNSMPSTKGMTNPNDFLAGLESSLGPEKAGSEKVKQPADAIFGSDKELGSRANAVEADLNQQGQQIGILNEVTQIAQAATRNAMTQQLQETRDISTEIQAGTQELKDKVKPVFQARGRVADQLDKLATMNPLERGLRKIFDLNYDKDYLTGQLDQFDRTLQARAYDYDYLNKLQSVALQEVERRFKTDTAMPSLLQEQAKEDLGLVGMRLTNTVGMLGNLKDRISTESQVIAAKAGARQDLMTRIDTPALGSLVTQAEQNGGMVAFNGVEFSATELRDRILAKEQQELQIEGYKMAVGTNRMEFADKYATNLARTLTRGQLEAAIQNGGVHAGVTIPQDVLTNLYQSAQARDAQQAEVIANTLPAKAAMQVADDYLNQSVTLYNRGKDMFGHPAMESGNPYLVKGSELVRKLMAATEADAPPETITALTQAVAANSAGFTKFIDDKILTQMGGDKRAAGYMKGFFYGQQLSEGTAAEALTYFAVKGNLPEGVSLSPEVKQVFAKAQATVNALRGSKGSNGKPISEDQLISSVQAEVTKIAPTILGQARHDRLFGSLPQLAKNTGHPFGKFDSTRWAEIKAAGEYDGATAVASGLGITPQEVIKMMRTNKPLTNDENGKTLFANMQAAAAKANAVESQTIIKQLNMEPSLVPGKSNSSLMADFMGSSNFAESLRIYSSNLGSQTVGEYMINPLVKGALNRNFEQTRNGFLQADAEVRKTQRAVAQNPNTNLLMNAPKRTFMILESIPGVDRAGAKALQPFTEQFYGSYYKSFSEVGIMTPNARFMKEDAGFHAALSGTKFEDPKLESYRKAALKSWKDNSTAQQGFAQRMIDGIFGDSFE